MRPRRAEARGGELLGVLMQIPSSLISGYWQNLPSRSELFSGRVRSVSEVFDISIREPGTTTVYGQTSRSMLETYQLVREFGITRTQIASFSFGKRYTVQDQFVQQLAATGDDLSGCFASFTVEEGGSALARIKRYHIPNIFLDVFIGDAQGSVDLERAWSLATQLVTVIRKARSILPAPTVRANGRPVGEIFVNLGDFLEQRPRHPEFFEKLLPMLQREPIQAICFEEFRGAALPEDVFDAAAALRANFTFSQFKLLAHMHGGNGLEDACNLAAVAGGADGVWASMTPTSALAGHGSSVVFLTNLYRYGNRSILNAYNLKDSNRIVQRMYGLNYAGREPMPLEMPVFGRNAYAVNFAAFSQDAPLPGLLPAEIVGVPRTTRFVPLLNTPDCIRSRLLELNISPVTDQIIEKLVDAAHQHLLDDINADRDTRVDFNAPEFILRVLAKPEA
jgi:hypothetical protein